MSKQSNKKLYKKLVTELIIESARLEIVRRSPKGSPCGYELITNIAKERVDFAKDIMMRHKAEKKKQKKFAPEIAEVVND
jgi:hypothetical protein